MSATLQFLSNRWVDYMRGAYKLRKTYKKYEQLFEWITGESTADYPHLARRRKRAKTSIRKKKHAPPAATCSSSTSSSSSQPSTQHHPRSFPSPWSVKGGIFFGLGLLILIFSLLPPKLAKLLNTFGFYASRPFALQLLQEAYHLNDELYSPLSAMALLAYYTSLSSFIHPQLLPSSFNLAKARAVVDATKAKFPQGKIWKLLEGKLCRMEGDLAKSVQVLRDCRRRNSVCTSVWQLNQKYQKQYDALIAKGANKDVLSPCLQQFQSLVVSELSLQISALSVYEMGWGQIFLGDYFQASETFFRLESMNNWSRAFYHYIATCCLYGDEEYDKAALDFMQIPKLLARRRRHGSRLMPNEQFADHVIRQWLVQAAISSATATATVAPMTGRKPSSSSSSLVLTGASLQKVALVHPLWELIYVWHGLYHVSPSMLATMQVELQKTLDTLGKWSTAYCSERARLYLLLGVVQRECGDDDHAETCFKRVLMLKKVCHLHHRHNDHPIQPPVSQQDQQHQPMHESASSANASTLMGAVSWAGPYALYELALLKALQLEKVSTIEKKRHIAREAKDYLHKIDSPHGLDAISHDEWMAKDISYEAAYMLLHVRCQLLAEKLDELVDA
ncbi:hypothetical protein BC940DRAFT_289429 [Gongronella butleri]|nr:hypothetical protein BC940DRAFT_289429 [Gongronella butleri]